MEIIGHFLWYVDKTMTQRATVLSCVCTRRYIHIILQPSVVMQTVLCVKLNNTKARMAFQTPSIISYVT